MIGNRTNFQRRQRRIVYLPAMTNDQQLLNSIDIYRHGEAQVQDPPPALYIMKSGQTVKPTEETLLVLSREEKRSF